MYLCRCDGLMKLHQKRGCIFVRLVRHENTSREAMWLIVLWHGICTRQKTDLFELLLLGDFGSVQHCVDTMDFDGIASKAAIAHPFPLCVNENAPHQQSVKDKLEMFAFASVAKFPGKLTNRQRDMHHGLRMALLEPMKLASMDFTEVRTYSTPCTDCDHCICFVSCCDRDSNIRSFMWPWLAKALKNTVREGCACWVH